MAAHRPMSICFLLAIALFSAPEVLSAERTKANAPTRTIKVKIECDPTKNSQTMVIRDLVAQSVSRSKAGYAKFAGRVGLIEVSKNGKRLGRAQNVKFEGMEVDIQAAGGRSYGFDIPVAGAGNNKVVVGIAPLGDDYEARCTAKIER